MEAVVLGREDSLVHACLQKQVGSLPVFVRHYLLQLDELVRLEGHGLSLRLQHSSPSLRHERNSPHALSAAKTLAMRVITSDADGTRPVLTSFSLTARPGVAITPRAMISRMSVHFRPSAS